MTHFIQNGPIFTLASEESLPITDKLPEGNFIVGFSERMGFFLERVESFPIPKKIYGEVPSYANRIIKTYQDRDTSTGVLLMGEKGSGKTLLTKLLSRMAADYHQIPTLIVNKPLHGDGFNTLLQQIHQDCIVLFDEFEKVYDADQQKDILTLLDGVFPTKKLYLLTVNDPWKVDSHMKNRPGRLFYTIEFDGLSEDFIRSYCNDNLTDNKKIEEVCKTTSIFEKFNFDMLKALVEEMNRYGESPKDAFKFLNIHPEIKKSIFKVEIFYKGRLVKDSDNLQGNPLTENHRYSFKIDPPKKNSKKRYDFLEHDEAEYKIVSLSPQKITHMDGVKGIYTFEIPEDEVKVILTKEIHNKFSFKDYAF